jgi:conjugative transposon TraM protein
MNKNEQKKSEAMLQESVSYDSEKTTTLKTAQLKKLLVFALMAITFTACMYLIFKPSVSKKEAEHIGLNATVPDASSALLPANKEKAYELDVLDKQQVEKRAALQSLSDYWNTDIANDDNETLSEETATKQGYRKNNISANNNAALNNYRSIQSTMGNFYNNSSDNTAALQKQIEELKEQLTEKTSAPSSIAEDQLAVMEKSYQIAAKYFPAGEFASSDAAAQKIQKDTIVKTVSKPSMPLVSMEKNIVSALSQNFLQIVSLNNLNETNSNKFNTVDATLPTKQPKNSINACVHETETVSPGSSVQLRLLEPATLAGMTIPQGELLTATARFVGNRLQLLITSVEYGGNIIAVDITAYDNDGQQGLPMPYSLERNAATEIIANMGNTAGTSVALSSSTSQQMLSDLSKSAVQGLSGYFSKKIKTPKAILKAGCRVLLVSNRLNI